MPKLSTTDNAPHLLLASQRHAPNMWDNLTT